MIHVAENCVLVHVGECHSYAQHYAEGKERCARQILKYEGFVNVTQFLATMFVFTKGKVAEEEIRYIKGLQGSN